MKPTGDKKVVSEIPRAKKSTRRILTVAVCLLLVVALGVVGALPGIGQNYPVYALDCHAVHQHDDSCYRWEDGEKQELICGKADYAIHIHDENCYNVDETGKRTNLFCDFEEIHEGFEEPHEHTSECKIITREVLNCPFKEDLGHQHSPYCFTDGKGIEPRCGIPSHSHDESCYGSGVVQLTLIPACTEAEHQHGDGGCEGDTTAICGMEDDGTLYLNGRVHEHGAGCLEVWNTPDFCAGPDISGHVITHTADIGDECIYNEDGSNCDNPEHYEITNHPEECYIDAESEPVCGAEAHEHTQDCYECDLPEHTHGFSHEWLAGEIAEKYPYVETVEILGRFTDEPVTYPVSYFTDHLYDDLKEYPDNGLGCYTLEEVEGSALACGQAEHIHSFNEGCGGEYENEDGLLCGIEESAIEHEHTAECYKTITEYSCVKQTEPHTHTDNCRDEAGNLICGLLELTEHQHTPQGCLVEVERDEADENNGQEDALNGDVTTSGEDGGQEGDGQEGDGQGNTSDAETGPIYTGEYILLGENDVEVTLYYVNPSNNSKTEIKDDEMLKEHLDGYFAIDVKVKQPIIVKDLENNHYTIHYQLPEYFKLESAKQAFIIGGQEVGWIECVPGDNIVVLTFSEGYLKGQINDLKFSIGGEFDLEKVLEEGKNGRILGKFNVTITGREEEFLSRYSTLKLEKKVNTAFDTRIQKQSPLQEDESGAYYFVDYTLTAKAGEYGYPDVVVEDAFTNLKSEQLQWFTQGPNGQTIEKIEETSNIIYAIPGDTYVRGEQTVRDDNFTPNGNPPDSPVGFTWEIGDMEPHEVRTLTYRVYLRKDVVDRNKAYTMGNKAAAHSESVDGDKPEAVISTEIKAGAEVKKRGIPAENLAEGGASIEYRVLIQANADNQHGLDLILTDTLNTTNNAKLLDYLSFDLTRGLEVYKGDYYTKTNNANKELKPEDRCEPAEGKIEWSGLPGDSKENLWFKIYGMEPGEQYTLVYTVNVSPEAYLFDNYKTTSKTFNVENRVTLKTQELEGENVGLTGQKITEKIFYTQLTKRKWAEKIMSAAVKEENLHFPIPAGAEIYSFNSETGALNPEPETATTETKRDFGIEHSYYPYTVKVNDGGIWNVNSWAMTDTLDGSKGMVNKHSPHMEYVGYVKVTGTRKAESGPAETRTVWVNVDQMIKFSFSGTDLGFGDITDRFWEYELTYYTQPKNLDKMLEVHFGNRFDLVGAGGGGSGGLYVPGFNVEVEDILAGTLSFEGKKQGWYYDASDAASDKGAFYWVLEVKSGDEEQEGRIPKDVELVDKIEGGEHQFQNPDQGKLVIDAFIAEPDIDFESFESYDAFLAAWDSRIVRRLTVGTETATTGPDGTEATESTGEYMAVRADNDTKKLVIRFLEDVELDPATQRLYFVIRTIPTSLPGENPIQYKNALYLSAKGELGYELHQDDDVISLPGSKGVTKKSGTLFYADGKGRNTIINKGDDENQFMAKQYYEGGNLVNLEPGMYATWLVETNIHGDLLGEFEVRDQIPAGMELTSVALYGIGNYNAGQTSADQTPRMPTPGEIAESGWTPHRSAPSNGSFSDWENWNYYTREIDSASWAAWRVNWSHYGAEDKLMGNKPYTVTFAVICRITDDDVLLGDSVDGGDVLEGGSEVTDGAATKKTFTNTAYLYKVEEGWKENDPFDSSMTERDINYMAQIVKTMPLKSGTTVECTIDVNPYGMDLNKEGDEFEVIDMMSKNIELKDSSITVTVFDDEHPNGYAIEETGWDRNKNLTIGETKDGSPVLRLILPDGKKIKVKYTIRINAEPNKEVTVRNVAFYKGHYATPDGIEQSSKFKIQMDLSFTTSATALKLIKQSSLTHEALEGAEFTLTKAEFKDGELVKLKDDAGRLVETTNADGEILFDEVQTYTLYCLEETRAPAGYLAREPEFIVLVYDLSPAHWAFADTAVELEEAGKLYICHLDPNELVRELPTIYNSQGEITVTKKFLEQGGNEMDPTVIPNGDYRFGLYQKDESGNLVPVKNPQTNEDYILPITVPEANTEGSEFSAKFENLVPGTYYVFELDAKNNRLENNSSWELKSMVFVTEYGGEDEGIVLTDPAPAANVDTDAEGETGTSAGQSMAGEVVVTNTAIQSYRLPRTGGEGASTVLYTAGGLMIVGAGLLLAMKKRTRGQE